MGIETVQYVRKPLFVEAVQVSDENFDALVAWCGGEAKTHNPGDGSERRYIHVDVTNPKNPRQTKAFVGDWILYTDHGGYKVYTDRAFQSAFDRDINITVTTQIPVETTAGSEAGTPQNVFEDVAQDRADVAPPQTVEDVSAQQPIVPAAAEGKRVLSIEEQKHMPPSEIEELLRSGEVVLAQEIADPEVAQA